jgi:hypothetical protein
MLPQPLVAENIVMPEMGVVTTAPAGWVRVAVAGMLVAVGCVCPLV